MLNSIAKYIPHAVLVITVSSILQWSSLPLNITSFWWVINAFILLMFFKAKSTVYNVKNDENIFFVKWYLYWNIFCIVRGFFEADNYWEWKNLIGTAMVLLLPLSIYMSTNTITVQRIVSLWIRYGLPAFFLFAITFTYSDAVGRYLVPVSFLMLFFPLLTNKWKIVVLAFSAIVFLSDLNARSNVIKFTVPLLFSFLYYVRSFVSKASFETGRIILIVAPIILFILGVLGIFNIFKMDEYLSGDYTTEIVEVGEVKEASLTADTRTGIYIEVLESALKYDYILLGRTPARGNESFLFGEQLMEELKTGKRERFSNEVSILNVFTWTGIIGAFLYLLIFFRASFLAINRSNNFIMKVVGLYVAFRWAYAWVEDFSKFDLSFVFLWIMIGMCYSRSFRTMDDVQIKLWVRGIFSLSERKRASRYNKYLKYKILNKSGMQQKPI